MIRGMRLLRSRILAAALGPALAVAIAACGSTSPGSGSAGGQTPTSTNSTSSGGTSTGTSTSSLPGTGKPTVTIGDKNYTEQFVLGDLYREALQAQGYAVALNQNIGPTSVTLQAMANGSLDMYPEYLNVYDSTIAGYARSFATRGDAYQAGQRYAVAHNMELLTPTPFSDTPALAVTVGFAATNHLHTLRDLSSVASKMTLGGPPQFQQGHPGLSDLEQIYGFKPASYQDLAVGDQYSALDDGTIQAADVNTTDGELGSGDYRLLSDPDNVLGWGNVVPVVTTKALAVEGPAFMATINRISAMLTMPVIRELNQLVDVAGQDPAEVAKEFLETHGIIPSSS
jgi:osmoprotectant transport system substrate-binding protein